MNQDSRLQTLRLLHVCIRCEIQIENTAVWYTLINDIIIIIPTIELAVLCI